MSTVPVVVRIAHAAGFHRLRRSVPLLLGDLVLVVAAWVVAVLLRYDAGVPRYAWHGLLVFLPIVVVVTVLMHRLFGLYAGVLGFASVPEARAILMAQTSAVVVLFPLVFLTGRPVPLSVPIIATLLSSGGAGAVRFWSRLVRWRRLVENGADRMLVLGAGQAGDALVKAFAIEPQIQVVGLLDDRENLHGLRLHGVTVLGPLSDVERLAAETGATRAVLAIAGASPALVREVANKCGDAGIGLRVVPSTAELLGRPVSAQDVRDLQITDLLGRPQVETDLNEIAELLADRRVLITGGGGSIGSELARQVAAFGPRSLALLDHDETHLFDAAATLPSWVRLRLADIRSPGELEEVFAQERPEIVFHAAALKHVPLLETHPVQAATTNVLGTRNLLDACRRHGVSRIVQISTDKAVRPSNVMGTTKLMCEHMVLAETSLRTCAVRFGNVLGSRGSVVPTFVQQIRSGGPVTITDGRMTRYFMSIPEAVRLVLHAAALSDHGEIFMLDMGEPVRIVDLARRMIQLSGQQPGADVEVRVTSIRPGEKLAEQLHDPQESTHSTSHPSVVRLEPLRLPAEDLATVLADVRRAVEEQSSVEVRLALGDLLALRERVLADPATVQIPRQRRTDAVVHNEEKPAWT